MQRARLPAGQRTLEEDLPNAAKTCFSTNGEKNLSTFQIICLGLLMNIRCEIESIEGQMTNLIDDSILTTQMHNCTSVYDYVSLRSSLWVLWSDPLRTLMVYRAARERWAAKQSILLQYLSFHYCIKVPLAASYQDLNQPMCISWKATTDKKPNEKQSKGAIRCERDYVHQLNK